jgi:hypothetical protein
LPTEDATSCLVEEILRLAYGAAIEPWKPGLEVAYVVLRAPLPVCADRVEKREKVPLPDPEVIPNLWSQFEDLGEFEANRLEAGGMGPDEIADAVEELLAVGSHLV